MVRTTWTSTALKIPVEVKISDPQRGTSDMELTVTSQTEPAASLFTVPSTYTIKTVQPGANRPNMMRGRNRSNPNQG
jgi:hypothetical protein